MGGGNDGTVVEGLTVGDVGDSVGNEVGAMGYSQLQAIDEDKEPRSLEIYQIPLYESI